MNISLLGIDLAKKVFYMHGVDGRGQARIVKRVSRASLLGEISSIKPCRIVMEACGGSNYWAREFERYGHRVELISPQYVKPFVKRGKSDKKDAEAITIAASQPTMRYVPRRTEEQQDIQNLHRIRERLVKARTGLVNEVRGLLGEYGIIIPQGRMVFERSFLAEFSKHEERLSSLARDTFRELWTEYLELNQRVTSYEKKLKSICKAHPICLRLMEIPGVGYLTATAVVAAVKDVDVFKNGREFSAWLGLTPREHSTGGKQTLLGISKRGDSYIRKLLIHGARITIRHLKDKNDRLSLWTKSLLKRKGTNRTTVALANKNARVIWSLLKYDQHYQTFPLAA